MDTKKQSCESKETGKDAGGLLNVGEYNGADAGEFGELEEGKDINPEII